MTALRPMVALLLCMTFFGALAQSPGQPGTQVFHVAIDADGDSASGATWARIDGSSINGIDILMTIRVDSTSVNPQVTDVFFQRGQQGQFDGPIRVAGGWPVGLDVGVNGADAVEAFLPLGVLGRTSQMRIYADAGSALGGEDILSNAGMVYVFAREIPTLGPLGLTLLLIALLGCGLVLIRRRKLGRIGLGALCVFTTLLLFAALAPFAADGDITDWNGIAPLGLDPEQDSSDPAADLVAFFAADENDNLFVRCDVKDIENHPPDAIDDSFSVDEDSTANNLDVLANDTDPESDALTITATGATSAGGTVTIAAGGTALTYTPAADYFGSETFTYTISDNHNGSDTATVTVTVNNVNDNPDAVDDSFSAFEDSTANTLDPLANDSILPDTGESLTITAVGTPSQGGSVSIGGGGANLSYTPAANYNGDETISYTIGDGNGGSDTATITVNVTGTNDAPIFTVGTDPVVLEDFGTQTLTAWATNLEDGDGGGQTLTFNVTANTNPALFAIAPQVDGATGTLTFTTAANANGSADITLTLSDNGGTAHGGVDTSAPQTFTITVTPVNDAPSFTSGGDVTVLEDAGPQKRKRLVAWASAIAAGPADESAQTLTFNITGNSNPGLFATAPSINAGTGELSYETSGDASGSSTLTVTLSDNGGTANGGVDTSAPQTFTITVTDVNDPPSFTVGADPTSLEDATAQSLAGWATAISAGPGAESAQNLTFNVTANSNPALFAVAPAVAADGTLTYTSAANANGSATVTLELQDDGGTANGGNDTSPAQTFTIHVTAVNDVPSFTVGADQTVLEGAGAQSVPGWATALSAGPADEAGQSLSFTITANSNPTLFSAAPAVAADGTLSYTAATEANGSATLSLTLSDNGGTANGGIDTSTAQSFTIVVTAVNDAPSFTPGADQTVLEDSGSQTVNGWATNLDDGDGGGQVLTFIVTGNTNPGLFSSGPAIDGSTGNLTYTTAANANGSATVTITLMDDAGTANGGIDTSAASSFAITLTPVNDVPSFAVGADQTVLEGAGAQSVAGWATALSTGPADEAGQSLSFAITGNTNPGLFSSAPAVAADGTLSFTANTEANGVATVTLTLSDNGGTANGGVDTSAAQSFTITLTAVNDAPSFTPGADPTVLEDAGAQTVSGWATSLDDGDGGGQTLTFVVTGNTNPGLFASAPTIDGSSGDLSFTTAANANGSATLTIELQDDGGTANGGIDTSAASSFTINVTPVNDVPSFTVGANQTVLEGAGAQSVAGWATALSRGPADESGQTLNFAITGNTNPGLFSSAPAVAADGTLSFTANTEANGVATVTLTLSDNGGTANGGVDTSAAQSFTITLTAVNDAPSFTPGADPTVLEDAGAQSVSGWATSLDDGDGGGQTLTFVVTGNTNPGLFASAPTIDGSSGDLSFTTAANANGSATLTIELQDDGGTANGGIDTSAASSFTINVTPVNDVPSFTVGANQTVLEGAGAQSVAGWATALSRGPADESGQTLSFAITGNTNPGLFSSAPAVAANGTLSFTANAEANGVATVTLTLSDDGGTANGGVDTSAAQSFTITLSAVNDPPSFTPGADQTVLEDAGAQTVSGWATNLDDNDGGGQVLTFNVVGNSNPGLFASGPAIDGSSGDLTFTTAANANGSATLTIELQDDGGTANGGDDTSASISLTISVTAVNDVPSFTVGLDQTLLEGAGAQSVAAWATALSTGPADESGQALSFNITGNTNPGMFSVAPAVAADGTLTYTAAPDANGSATVTLTLSDDGGTADGGVDTSAAQTFIIDVTGVNDPPSFTPGADQTVLEDAGAQTVSGWATNLDDNDGGGQVLTFNVTGNTNPGLFSSAPSIDGSSGDLTFTTSADANGSATLTIELQDDGGTANGGDDTSASISLTINVTAVNDVPAFTVGADQTVLEGAGAQSVVGWATGLSRGPSDESGQTLSFNITGNTNPGLFAVAPAVAANGTLSYTANTEAFGSATITLSISDDGGTANGGVDTSATQTFAITITGINDAPSFTDGADQTVLEDAGAQTVNGWATNLDDGDGGGQTLTFSVTGNTNPGLFSAGPAVDGSNGDLTFTPAADAVGSATLTIQLQDNGGTANGGNDTSGAATFTINVTAVNDAPTFNPGSDQTVLEDAGPQKRFVAWASALSPGPADESAQNLTFNITGNSNPGLFSAGPSLDASGVLSYTTVADAVGSATLTVSLQDDGGTANGGDDTSGSVMFDITVTGVNDPPSFTAGADVSYIGAATLQTVAGWATNLSPGPADESGQNLTFNVTGNTNSGLFTSGPAIDGSSGDLTYTPVNGVSGTATVTIELQDDGGTTNGGDDTSGSASFDIQITAQNQEPSFTVGADQTVLEDAGAQTVNGWATNMDDGDGGTQVLTFNITGNTNPGLFDVAPAVDPSSGDLTYTPAADANGSATITLALQDDGGTAGGGDDTSASAMFVINVTAVNDQPSFTDAGDQTVGEDAGAQNIAWASAISAGPANESGQTLTFNITGNTLPALFSAAPAIDSSGNLTFTSTANASGTATLTVTLSDNGGTANGGVDTTSAVMFDITVTPVNDPPSVAADAGYATAPNVSLAVDRSGPSHGHLVSTFTNVLDNDSDIDSASFTVKTIVGSGDTSEPFIGTTTLGGSVEMYADGSFHYHPPAGTNNTTDTFQYTAEDVEGGTNNGTVSIALANADPIWFIDTAAAGGGTGTIHTPFNTLAAFQASAQNASDTIFIYRGNTGTTPINGQITLAAGQHLHGEAVALSVTHPEDASSVQLVAAGSRPVLVSTSGDVVTLGSGTSVVGVEIRPTVGAGIFSGTSALKRGDATEDPKRAGSVTITNVIVSPTGAERALHLGNETGTYTISNCDFRGLAGHTGAGMLLEDNGATVNLTSCLFGSNGVAVHLIDPTGDTTLADTTITQTGAGFSNQAILVDGSSSGSPSLTCTSTVSVANLGAGKHAIDIDGAGGEFDLSFASTTTTNINASGGTDGLIMSALGTGSVVDFAGAFNITGAGGKGVNLSQLVGSYNFDDLAISGVTGTHFDLDNSNATFTVTLDGTTGITSSGGRALEITNLTGGSVNFDGGTITAPNLGVHITGNALGATSTIANNLDIDNTGAIGLVLTNNTGSQLALTGSIDVRATDIQAVNIATNNNIAISGAAVTTVNGGSGGALALNISNVTTLAATFTSVTAVNTAGEGINLDTNGGTTTFNNLNLTTTGGIGFDASNAGTININNSGGGTSSVTTTNALGLDINNTTFGTSGGTSRFSAVNVTGTGGGINLNTTSGTIILADIGISVSGTTAFVASSATVNVDPTGANSATLTATGQRAFTLSSVTTTGFNLSTTSSSGSTNGIVASSCNGTFNFGDTTITSSGNGVDLSSSASGTFTFDDLDITSSAGVALAASSAGTINVDTNDDDSPVLSATTKPVLDIDNCTIHLNLATLTSTTSTTHGVDLTNILNNSTMGVSGTTTLSSPTTYGVNIDDVESGSSLVFGNIGITNRGSHGIFIQDHDGTTITFGDADIANGLSVGGNGVHVQKSGVGATSTGSITFASLDISSTNATVNRADSGGDGIPDNETHDGHGVMLIDHTGGLIVHGDGTQGNGGTIQTIEGDGFSLIRSGGLNLDEMTINNIGTTNQAAASVDNAGIWAYNLVGSNTIANSTISRFQDGSVGGGSSCGVWITNNGTSFTNFHTTDTTFFNDNSLLGDDGIQLITNGAVSGALIVDSAFNLNNVNNNSEFYHISGTGIQVIQNGSGTLTTSISDTTFRDTITPGGFGGVDIASAGSGILSSTIDECLFLDLYPGGVNNSGVISLFATGTPDFDATVNNCTFGSATQRTSDGRGAIRASTDTDLAATVTDFDITITNNTIDDTDREAISLLPRGGAVPTAGGRTMDIIVSGNTIGQTTAVANDAGLGREGIEFVSTENARIVNFSLLNNTIRNFVDSSSDETVDIDADGGTSLNLTVRGNTFSQSGSTTDSIDIATLNASSSICLDMNSANTSSNACPNGITITETAGTFSLEDIGGSSISAATVKTFIEARNSGTATVTGTFDSCNSH